MQGMVPKVYAHLRYEGQNSKAPDLETNRLGRSRLHYWQVMVLQMVGGMGFLIVTVERLSHSERGG